MTSKKLIGSKPWLWLIALLVIIVAALIVWQGSIILHYGNEGGRKPHLSVKEIKVNDIGENKISMTAKVMVSNPLLIQLDVERLRYSLFVDSAKVVETDFVKPIIIKALDSAMLVVPMVVLRKNLVSVLDRFEKNNADSADYTLKAKLFLRLPVAGDESFTVNKTQRKPAFRMLNIKTEDVDIEQFGFRHSDVSMKLRVGNPNPFALNVDHVIYELTIGKDMRLNGKVNELTIPARSSITLPLEMDVHTKNIPRLAWQVLFRKKHTQFHINFGCKIAGTDDTFKNTRLALTESGQLDELKKASQQAAKK